MQAQHTVQIDTARCIRCGLCVRDCPYHAIRMTENGAQPPEAPCLQCAHCVAICPQGAVSMTGFDDAPIDLTALPRVDGDALLGHIRARRSVRSFTQEPVAPELLEKILAAGQYTPNAVNAQNVSYIVLRDRLADYEAAAVQVFRRAKVALDAVTKQYRSFTVDEHFFFKGAPVVILIKSPDRTNAALAASAMELTAQAYGLGAFYCGFFVIAARLSPKLRHMLRLGHGEKLVAVLVLGHPGVHYRRTAPKERPDVRYE